MRDWVTKDFYWKAFSVLMAVGIWLTVRRESEAESPPARPVLAPNTYGNVMVSAVSANGDMRSARVFPQMVTATISGTPEVMNRLQRSQIHAFVNLTGLNSAQNLSRDVEISLPRGATIVNIVPPQVSVTLPK